MRTPEALLDPLFVWKGIGLIGFAVVIASIGISGEWRGRRRLAIAAVLAGLAIGWFAIPVAGGAFLYVSAAPLITLLIGLRTAVWFGALMACLEALLMPGFGWNSAGANFLFSGLVAPLAAVSAYRSFALRSRSGRGTFYGKLAAAGLAAWFSVIACVVTASFVVPLFGKALWGVFGSDLSKAALWFGAVEGIFTMGCLALLRDSWEPSTVAADGSLSTDAGIR